MRIKTFSYYLFILTIFIFLPQLALASGEWQQLYPSVSPDPRYYHDMVYDSNRDRVVLFGGKTLSGLSNETWEYDGTTWNKVNTTMSPSPRWGHAMVFNPHTNRVILFGGCDNTSYKNDIWEYDGKTWTQIFAQNASSPSPRAVHAMAYDEVRNVIILFGGYGVTGRNNETWEYEGSDWTQVTPLNSPAPREDHAMTYDNTENVVILYGGKISDETTCAETWKYDGTTWTEISVYSLPDRRVGHKIVSSPQSIIFFGGLQGVSGWANAFDDTFEYGGNIWKQIITNNSPSPKFGHGMVFDSKRSRVLLFGGADRHIYKNIDLLKQETWEYVISNSSCILPTDIYTLYSKNSIKTNSFLQTSLVTEYETKNIFLVVIDGLRSCESFLDEDHEYITHIWNDMAPLGTINLFMQTFSKTHSTDAHYSLLTGVREGMETRTYAARDESYRPQNPTIFEYYRKKFQLPETSTAYVPGNSLIWRGNYSLHPLFGFTYGAQIPDGEPRKLIDPLTISLLNSFMDQNHPSLTVINLIDVDDYGHQGVWEDYTGAIAQADQFIYDLWNKIQSDPVYADKTTMIVTTDHGRHDDKLTIGNFRTWKGHGSNLSEGDRRILFLALGPDFKGNKNVFSLRSLIDIPPTIGELLGFETPYANGRVMWELFKHIKTSSIHKLTGDPIPSNPKVALTDDAYGSRIHIVNVRNPRRVTDGNEQAHYYNMSNSTINYSMQLSDSFTLSVSPYITATSDNVLHCLFVGWLTADGTYSNNGDWQDVYYMKSHDNGQSWTKPLRVSSYLTDWAPWTHEPVIEGNTRGDFLISVVPFPTYIMVNRSRDGGNSWDGASMVSDLVKNPRSPMVRVRGSNILIVFHDVIDNITGGIGIYYLRSSDMGDTWSKPFLLSESPGYQLNPSLTLHKNTFHVLWQDNRNGLWQIFYSKSADNGQSWSNAKKLSANLNAAVSSHIVSTNNRLFASWIRDEGEESGIYYTWSYDNGETWVIPRPVQDSPSAGLIRNFDMAYKNGKLSFVFDYWDQNDDEIKMGVKTIFVQ